MRALIGCVDGQPDENHATQTIALPKTSPIFGRKEERRHQFFPHQKKKKKKKVDREQAILKDSASEPRQLVLTTYHGTSTADDRSGENRELW